jgi:hypothetical protein
MYVDGHEREDVVAYRAAFVKRWLEHYEPRMVEYDNDSKVIKDPAVSICEHYKAKLKVGIQGTLLYCTHSTSEGTRNKILPNMEILHNSVRQWLIFVFSTQRTHVKATKTIPQKNPYSFHF